MGTGFATDGRESSGNGTLLALGREDVCHTQLWNGVGTFEEAMSTAALGVDDTFWNSLAVKMREQINEVEVLDKKGAVLSSSLTLVGMWDGHTITGGVNVVLRGSLSVRLI